ncbi:hypothetical protein AJ80_08976 [Polytolypa hystricis UAMH7299]|uniref:Uncharacterized protein n=1 Tax=Polytolypa hystricis (strain UAMH7299) TaxID=1447883 RepID=A0A2B7WYM4_POLH7|nr:hypothetical protein AJ80_08976 [Polytolypa hystricis UAMH7299]
MASFIEDLWTSVFVAGPTPTLLVATNVSFAALQLVLFVLLLATYSVHFVVLSFLSGGLWWAINWFAAELKAAEEAERVKEKKDGRSQQQQQPPGAMDESETETESVTGSRARDSGAASASSPSSSSPPAAPAAGVGSMGPPTMRPSASGARSGPSPAAREGGAEEVRKRATNNNRPSESSSGYVSTDSEWEKVDERAG